MDKPENVYFADVMLEPMQRWALAVARHLAWQGSGPGVPQSVRECWVGQDLALYIRYANPHGRFGARFADLIIDPTSAQLIDPTIRVHSSGSAAQQASNLYDGALDGGAPETIEWTDDLGFGWWGDSPRTGWSDAVNGPRLDTVVLT